MTKTIAIDEEGFFILNNGVRLSDASVGGPMLASLSIDSYGVCRIDAEGETVIAEPFDKPFVARNISVTGDQIELLLPYDLKMKIDLPSLCLDDWDRFHGHTTNGIPFVFSRAAQAEFFNQASDFSDESVHIAGQKISTPHYYQKNHSVEVPGFWQEKYQETASPGWDLQKPHPELKSILQQIKINKMRVLVPGCGLGHDAALLAEQGHVVTAIDFSPLAIEQAKKTYGHIANLEFIQGDVFKLGEEHHNAYDLILEHTCFCAVDPDQRKQLIKVWSQCLAETGHLLGLFFVVPKRTGPYFGGSEWEFRELLEKRFKFLYWTRAKHSPDWRLGAELILYAQLKDF